MHAIASGSKAATLNSDKNENYRRASRYETTARHGQEWNRTRVRTTDMVVIRNKYTKKIVDLEVSPATLQTTRKLRAISGVIPQQNASGLSYEKSSPTGCSIYKPLLRTFLVLVTRFFFYNLISMAECNTILSDCTLYRHLG